jgi:AraC-like DNA-binding protein
LHSRLFLPVQITPQDSRTFDAEAGTESLGPIVFTRTTSPPATIELSEGRGVLDPPLRYTLLLPLVGNLRVSHHGTDHELEAGDFVLIDTRPPSRLSFAQPNQSIILSLAPATLAAHLPDAETLRSVPVHGDGGMGRVAGEMIKCLWQELVVGLPSELGPTIASNLLDVIASAYAAEHGIDIHGATRAKARKLQVKRFVEAHLKDPHLSPRFIAESLHLSSRYVRLLFAEEDEHLSSYILRRRLEKCAEQIRKSAWTRTTITDIALAWGFSSMSHFARVFRAHFDMTAGEYRRTSTDL